MKIIFRSRSPDHRFVIIENTDILSVLIDNDHEEFYYYRGYNGNNNGNHLKLKEWDVYDIVA